MNYSTRFLRCAGITFKEEGGGKITDISNDKGGLTKWGISLKNHPELGNAGLIDLTKDQALAICYKEYYCKISGDALPSDGLALCVYDFAFMDGVSEAAKLLQKILKQEEDGYIGPMTLLAAKAYDQKSLITEYSNAKLEHFQELVTKDFSQNKFLQGWKNRTVDIEHIALLML